VEVSFEGRKVALCVGHARIAAKSGVRSLETLREFYHESDGRRSFVPRRSRHPAAPARRNPGRRASDARG
jgi:hypothetical protein